MPDYISVLMLLIGAILVYSGYEDKRKYRSTAYTKQYELIYAPMAALFQRNGIESGKAILYPYFSTRFSRAKKIFHKNLREAIVALFNRGETKTIAAMSFGGCFPLDEIITIMQNNIAFADRKLRELVQDAHNSKRDLMDNDTLTDEEFSLFMHIMTKFEKLNHDLVR